MTEVIFYSGDEFMFQVAFQADNNTGAIGTGVTPEIAPAFIQNPVRLSFNANVQRVNLANAANGRNVDTNIVGVHDATLDFDFWVEKELAASSSIGTFWLLKLPIDEDATTATATYTIPPTTNEYGTWYLKVATIDLGYNKSGSVFGLRCLGTMVTKMVFVAEEGQFLKWTYNCWVKEVNKITSFASLSKPTTAPFHWGDTLVKYGAADAAATVPGIMRVEFTLDNTQGAKRNFELANATTVLSCNNYTSGQRKVSGVLRIRHNTNAALGVQLIEDAFGLDTATAPTETVVLKDIEIDIYQAASKDLTYYLNNVIIGTPFNVEFTGEGVQVMDIPFTAQSCVLRIRATDASAVTNWS